MQNDKVFGKDIANTFRVKYLDLVFDHKEKKYILFKYKLTNLTINL
jgi:hypothetical protein